MDEKGFLIGLASKAKVICRRGRRNPRYTCDGSRELITVLECVSVEGRLLPPIIVTKGAHHYSGNYVRGQGMPGSVYGHLPKCWNCCSNVWKRWCLNSCHFHGKRGNVKTITRVSNSASLEQGLFYLFCNKTNFHSIYSMKKCFRSSSYPTCQVVVYSTRGICYLLSYVHTL